MQTEPKQSVFNTLPPLIVALALLMGGVEFMIQAAHYGFLPETTGQDLRLRVLENYAFLDPVFEAMRAQHYWPIEHLRRFVTYPFVHFSLTHAALGIVFVLALGKVVAESFGTIFVLILFFVCAIVGAGAYALVWDTQVALTGAFPSAYGLIGAFTLLLWLGLGQKGANQFRAFSLIGGLMLIQLVFGLLFGGSKDWVADLSGFATGFVMSAIVGPGGWRAVVARLRRRS